MPNNENFVASHKLICAEFGVSARTAQNYLAVTRKTYGKGATGRVTLGQVIRANGFHVDIDKNL